MNIFKDGYLRSEFINPNYRGLVGWPCDYGNLIGTCKDGGIIVNSMDEIVKAVIDTEDLTIPQFTAKDIPVGEWCWFGSQYPNSIMWALIPNNKLLISDVIKNEGKNFYYCVPYLIAETEQDAEKLKDWSEE